MTYKIGTVTNVTKRYYFNVRYLRATVYFCNDTFGSYFSLRFVLSNFANFGSRAWDGIRIAISNSRNKEHDTWANLSKLLWKMGKKMFDVYFAESNIFRGNDNSAGMRLRHLLCGLNVIAYVSIQSRWATFLRWQQTDSGASSSLYRHVINSRNATSHCHTFREKKRHQATTEQS